MWVDELTKDEKRLTQCAKSRFIKTSEPSRALLPTPPAHSPSYLGCAAGLRYRFRRTAHLPRHFTIDPIPKEQAEAILCGDAALRDGSFLFRLSTAVIGGTAPAQRVLG